MRTKSRKRWRHFGKRAIAGAFLLCACDRPWMPEGAAVIELKPLVELRGSGDTVDITNGSRPYFAASGDIVVVPVAASHGHFAAYDSSGRLYKIFGRSGRGPGEVSVEQGRPDLNGIGFSPGDSLLVGDRQGLRIHVFRPPPELTLAREIEISRRPMLFEVTPYGLYEPPVKTSPAYTPVGRPVRVVKSGDMIGLPPRLSDFEGTERAVFGEYTQGAADYDVFGTEAVVDTAHIWFTHTNRYELELRRSDGTTVRTLKRNADWFPVDTTPNQSIFERAPPPRVSDMTVGPDGNLWVLVRKASRNWAKARPPKPPVLKPGMPISMLPAISMTDYYECVLEVLSSEDGRLLASRELPGDYIGFAGRDRIYQLAEDSTGIMRIRVFRMAMSAGRSR